MKKIILLLTALLSIPIVLPAQTVGVLTLGTNSLPGNTTNLVSGATATVGFATSVTLFVSYRSTNTVAASDLVIQFDRSIDSTNWTFNEGALRFTNAPVALTTNATFVCKFDLQGSRYIRENSIINRGGVLTNGVDQLAVKYFILKSP